MNRNCRILEIEIKKVISFLNRLLNKLSNVFAQAWDTGEIKATAKW